VRTDRRYRVDTLEQLGGKVVFVYFIHNPKPVEIGHRKVVVGRWWWENRDQEAPTETVTG